MKKPILNQVVVILILFALVWFPVVYIVRNPKIPPKYRFGLMSEICSCNRLEAPQALPFAVLVQTNLVYQDCSCGFCDPSRGLRVPEHINQIGYDLRIEVSTNFLPVVSLPIYNP